MGYHGPPPAHPPPPQQQYHAPPPAMPPAPTRMAMAAAASATPPPPMPPAPTSLAMAGVHHQQAGPPPPVPPAPTSGRSSLQSSGSSTPVASSSSADWAVPVASRAKFLKVFEQQDPGRTGFLSGVQARDLLLQVMEFGHKLMSNLTNVRCPLMFLGSVASRSSGAHLEPRRRRRRESRTTSLLLCSSSD